MDKKQYSRIEHNTSRKTYELSFQQERIWFMSQAAPNSSIWTKVSCKKIIGDFETDRYITAVKSVMENNEILRYRVKIISNSPIQYLDEDKDWDKYFVSEYISDEEEIQKKIDTISNTAVDIYSDTLFKCYIFSCDNCRYILLRLHHIISDAITFRLLWKKILEKYNNVNHEACSITYGDYAEWQRNEFTDDKLSEEKSIWDEKFKDYSNVLNLPSQRLILKNNDYFGESFEYCVNPKIYSKISKECFRMRVTPYSMYLGAFAVLLHFLCQQNDMVIGTVFNGRHSNAEIKELLGFFVNTIALRVNYFEDHKVLDFIKRINDDIRKLYLIQDYPYERLVNDLNLERSFGLNPLIRTSFNFINNYDEKYSFVTDGCEKWYQPQINSSQYDMAVDVLYEKDSALVRFSYSKAVYSDKRYIEFVARVYEKLLDFMIKSPEALINEIPMAEFSDSFDANTEVEKSKDTFGNFPDIADKLRSVENSIINIIDSTENIGVIAKKAEDVIILDTLKKHCINYYMIPNGLNEAQQKKLIAEHKIKYVIYDNDKNDIDNEIGAFIINYQPGFMFENNRICFNKSLTGGTGCEKSVSRLLSGSEKVLFADKDYFRFFYQCMLYLSNAGGELNWNISDESLDHFDTLVINSDDINPWVERINNSSIKKLIILYTGNKYVGHIINKIDNKKIAVYFAWRLQQNEDFYMYSFDSKSYEIMFSNTTVKLNGIYCSEVIPETCGCADIIIYDDLIDNGQLKYKTNFFFKRTINNNFIYYGDKRKQVYIRGLLIPCFEIQAYIESFDNIQEAYLTKDSSIDDLILYVCGNDDLDLNELKYRLSSVFPPIFVPKFIYEVNSFARNLNGSVNVEKISQKTSCSEEKLNEIELNDSQLRIFNIIKEILKDETLSLNDEFLNVGGHSIKALQIVVRLNKEFKVNISIDKIFNINNILKIILFVEKTIDCSTREEGCI